MSGLSPHDKLTGNRDLSLRDALAYLQSIADSEPSKITPYCKHKCKDIIDIFGEGWIKRSNPELYEIAVKIIQQKKIT